MTFEPNPRPGQEQVLVFLRDGMQRTIPLAEGQTWEAFVADYIRNGCIMTGDGIVERGGVAYINRQILLPPDNPPGQVRPLRPVVDNDAINRGNFSNFRDPPGDLRPVS